MGCLVHVPVIVGKDCLHILLHERVANGFGKFGYQLLIDGVVVVVVAAAALRPSDKLVAKALSQNVDKGI